MRLYHRIGTEILARQGREGWGTRIIERLAADLSEAFPDMKGFSSRNLKYMRVFAELCPDLAIGQQAAAQLPWFHIVTLLTKVADPEVRAFYARHVVEQGWSRATLQKSAYAQCVGRVSVTPAEVTALQAEVEVEAIDVDGDTGCAVGRA